MHVLNVTQFVAYLNDTFKAIWDPAAACLEGEITSFRISQGQWVNFDVKDEGALVSVFMVAQKVAGLPLADGVRVRLYGTPRVYPKFGKFSFSADRVELVGEGALKKALAMLRAKLEAEGMFDAARKRALPLFPGRIALVASKESAAYGDFLRILGERWGGLDIDVYHVAVQGADAPRAIVSALDRINQTPGYDVVVVTRGGGSMEELMAFNDESVVRAIFACKTPTLVGIGHERDVTLAEEVADVRGSTPTDCARRLVPDRREVLFQVASTSDGIADALSVMVERMRRQMDRALVGADYWINAVRMTVQTNTSRVQTSGTRWLETLRLRVEGVERLLASVDPRAVLRRGYALVRSPYGTPITHAAGLKPGSGLVVEFQDGQVDAAVLGGSTPAEQARLL